MAHSQVGEAMLLLRTATQDLVTETDIKDTDIRTAAVTHHHTADIEMVSRLPRLWKSADRLGEEEMIALIQDYRLGLHQQQTSSLSTMTEEDPIVLMDTALDRGTWSVITRLLEAEVVRQVSIHISPAMDLAVDDLREMTDHLEMTAAEEMIEMTDDMIGIEIEIEIEIGWITGMIAAAARELAVGAEVPFESVIGIGIGFVSENPWIGSGTESVIIGISIADENQDLGCYIQGLANGLNGQWLHMASLGGLL